MTTVNEDLESRLIAIRNLPFSEKEKQRAEWNAFSGNILNDDLGKFIDSTMFQYGLDEATRDRLIAHTRQDAAMAYAAASDTFHHAKSANKYAQWAVIFAFISMCVSVYVAYRLM